LASTFGWHAPLEHVAPHPQTLPHAPQLFASFCSSTQLDVPHCV
jgi:hypothetical protein